MSDERPGTRGQEHVIEIDASPADVWRAISEAEEVIRWYVADAQIDDHVGGTYKVSWGEGMD
ncbi:MAG: SRPBCC domain-containing protein, partial [Gemmatimonadota bacterium]|nr:SRPBCC domain-containing protein [Gemmatimonadota bacterium]